MDGKEASEAMSLHLEVSQFAVFLHESLRKFTARWLGDSNRQVELPECFEGRPRPFRRAPEPVQAGERFVLHGTPVAPGRVRGRARIVEDPGTVEAIGAGEILVDGDPGVVKILDGSSHGRLTDSFEP